MVKLWDEVGLDHSGGKLKGWFRQGRRAKRNVGQLDGVSGICSRGVSGKGRIVKMKCPSSWGGMGKKLVLIARRRQRAMENQLLGRQGSLRCSRWSIRRKGWALFVSRSLCEKVVCGW